MSDGPPDPPLPSDPWTMSAAFGIELRSASPDVFGRRPSVAYDFERISGDNQCTQHLAGSRHHVRQQVTGVDIRNPTDRMQEHDLCSPADRLQRCADCRADREKSKHNDDWTESSWHLRMLTFQ